MLVITGCKGKDDWKPDFIAYSNVKEIRISGLDGKPGIEFNIGYYETNMYKTKQKFKKYTFDTVENFSPGIDITYIAFEKIYNPPKYRYPSTFIGNVLTINIEYFDEGEVN